MLSSGEYLLKEVLGSPHPVNGRDTCRSFARQHELGQESGRLVSQCLICLEAAVTYPVDRLGTARIAVLRSERAVMTEASGTSAK